MAAICNEVTDTLKKAHVCVYLIIRRADEVLLSLRKNTGYLDGYYGLVAGHVEPLESATQGAVREALEEVGIHILPQQLQVVHVLHRRSERNNIDIFFEISNWQGEISNKEPHKCGEVGFYPIQQLPTMTVPYVHDVLNAIASGKLYSEVGWDI